MRHPPLTTRRTDLERIENARTARMLILKRLYPDEIHSRDIYEVISGETRIGRISYAAGITPPVWQWGLNFATHRMHGYEGTAPTREEAMAALRVAWRCWLDRTNLCEAARAGDRTPSSGAQ